MTEKNNFEYGYELAYKIAREQLANLADIEQQCSKSDSQCLSTDTQKEIIVEYLGQSYRVAFPDIEVSLVNSEEKVPLKEKILILHYLIQAKGTPASNKLMAYKELPEGIVYFPTFAKRAIKPIVDNFGKQPDLLVDTALKLSGQKADYGDAAATIAAFSRVPITFVLWKGDEEFPPEGNVLFDSTISDYLTIEDIHILCETIAWKLVKLLKSGGNIHGRN